MVKSMTLNMPYDEVVERIASETELSKDEIVTGCPMILLS